MAANIKTKRIVVKSRGKVLTSRGMCISPIARPYNEKLETIMLMISRYRADVYEVLDDGTEVKLTIQNFDKDNSVKTDDDATQNKPFTVVDRDEIKASHEAADETKEPEAPTSESVDQQVENETKNNDVTDTTDVGEVQETPAPTTDNTETSTEKPLSRKERKRLAAQQRAEEAAKAETAEVPEGAIEE